jgi:hypothetical protein
MPEVGMEEVPRTDTDIEQFAFTPILDDHDADVSDKDAFVRCIKGCS